MKVQQKETLKRVIVVVVNNSFSRRWNHFILLVLFLGVSVRVPNLLYTEATPDYRSTVEMCHINKYDINMISILEACVK